jgi:hypothetical protein
MHVIVQSAVPSDYRAALERLVFFNPRQHEARDAIIHALDHYGALEIAAGADGLAVTVSSRPDAQCLFALVPRRGRLDLAGGLVYLRTSRDELTVLHIAIAGRYCVKPHVSLGVVKQLLRSVRAVAHRLRGVERVSVLYRGDRSLRLKHLTVSFPGPAEPVAGSARAPDARQNCSSAA